MFLSPCLSPKNFPSIIAIVDCKFVDNCSLWTFIRFNFQKIQRKKQTKSVTKTRATISIAWPPAYSNFPHLFVVRNFRTPCLLGPPNYLAPKSRIFACSWSAGRPLSICTILLSDILRSSTPYLDYQQESESCTELKDKDYDWTNGDY